MGRSGTRLRRLPAAARAAVQAVLLCAGATLMPPLALAGGLYLNEFATPAMGAAGAGAEALAEDASTAFPLHNPAGMTRLEGQNLLVGGGLFFGDIQFDPESETPRPGNDGGNQGSIGPLLGTYYAQSLSDRWSIGASVFSVSGASLDPRNDWAGRFQLQEINLLTLSFNTALAFEVNDWLSVGVGASLIYGELELDAAVDPFGLREGQVKIEDADDFAGGWNVGFLVTPREGTQLGLIYVSKVELDLSGRIKTNLPNSFGLDLDIPLVRLARLGFSQELGRGFTLLGTVGWEDWSRFDNLPLSVRRLDTRIDTGWHDTFHFSLGLRHQWSERLMLQGGVTFDTSPQDSDDRIAALPVDRQTRVAVGAQYQWTENINVGAAFQYFNGGPGKINNETLKGEYDSNDIFFLAFNLSWKRPGD